MSVGKQRHTASYWRYGVKHAAPVSSSTGGSGAVWLHPPCAVHVVTAENRQLYASELEASFRLRHHVYVTERHWHEFRSDDQRELDQYDNDDAIYLLALEDGTRRLIGGARLVPTIKAPVLGEYSAIQGRHSLPRSPTIFHLSRSIVAPERRGSNYLNTVSATIMCGIQEYCLAEDIEQLTLLVRMSLLPIFMELGWNPQPLALPEMLWGFSCVVAIVDISEVALRNTRESRNITESVLVRRGISLPAVPSGPISGRLC